MTALLLLIASWCAAAGAAPAPVSAPQRPKNLPPPEHVFELPEDLGPSTIDVSDYPPEMQATYKDIFLPVYSLMRGGPKRPINSALLTSDDWKKEVMRLKTRPPCCGACPNLSMDQAKALWRFLAYDSLRRKTGSQAEAWARHRRNLLAKYQELQDRRDRP